MIAPGAIEINPSATKSQTNLGLDMTISWFRVATNPNAIIDRTGPIADKIGSSLVTERATGNVDQTMTK